MSTEYIKLAIRTLRYADDDEAPDKADWAEEELKQLLARPMPMDIELLRSDLSDAKAAYIDAMKEIKELQEEGKKISEILISEKMNWDYAPSDGVLTLIERFRDDNAALREELQKRDARINELMDYVHQQDAKRAAQVQSFEQWRQREAPQRSADPELKA